MTVSRNPPPFWLATPDSARYGILAVHAVDEFRRPRALFRFPDGGAAFHTARYREVWQVLPGGERRHVGDLHQRPVRRGDFGNPMDGGYEWLGDGRLRWWVRHGYDAGPVRTDTAELVIPPLTAARPGATTARRRPDVRPPAWPVGRIGENPPCALRPMARTWGHTSTQLEAAMVTRSNVRLGLTGALLLMILGAFSGCSDASVTDPVVEVSEDAARNCTWIGTMLHCARTP